MTFLEFWHHPICGGIIFMWGACLGSFLGVCVVRIPKNISIIFPGSRCDCGQPIPFYFNLPIIGWLLLRGKARCCGRKLEFWYIFLEVLGAVLYTLLWKKLNPVAFCVYGLFFGLLIVASGIDFGTMTIPDRCTIGGVLLGILGSIVLKHFSGGGSYIFIDIYVGGITALKGMLLGSSLLLWIAIFAELLLNKEAIGFGDVKLMGCIGAFIGTEGAIFSIFGGTCLGMVIIFPIWWLCNRHKKKIALESQLPFGPFLALGSMGYLLFFKEIVDEYFVRLRFF